MKRPASTIAASGRPLAMPLASGDDVGDDARVLEGPHGAGPAVARLDLIHDEQDAVLVGEPAQSLEEGDRAPG